jgi:hypothetical protein
VLGLTGRWPYLKEAASKLDIPGRILSFNGGFDDEVVDDEPLEGGKNFR